MATTLQGIVTELCETQRLRGQVLQACSMQKSYDEWSKDGHPKEGPDHEQLHLVFQWGIQYALDMLAPRMGVERYDAGDGSESVEGDVSITIDNIIREAGLAHENGDVFSAEEIKSKLNM